MVDHVGTDRTIDGRHRRQITAVAFYAMGDTRTPTMLFVWTFTIYIPIKVIVFLHYGLLGLAIATSVHLIVNFMLQLIFLEQVTARSQRSIA